MRPVTIFKMVPNSIGYGPWVKVHDFTGKFHQWGFELWEQEPASISYTVAIVEKDDGQIATVPPHLVMFDDVEKGGAA